MIGGDAGTSSRARLALTGDGVPASVFVNMPAETVLTRLMGGLGRLAHTEVLFYRDLSSQPNGLPTPTSAFDSLTGRYVLVSEVSPPIPVSWKTQGSVARSSNTST